MIRFRRILYWFSKQLRVLAYRVDCIADSTCAKTDVREVILAIQEKAGELGMAIPDRDIDLIIRFHEVSNRFRDKYPDSIDGYLIFKLQGALPFENKLKLILELEKEIEND